MIDIRTTTLGATIHCLSLHLKPLRYGRLEAPYRTG
jgi:hypothetical protein